MPTPAPIIVGHEVPESGRDSVVVVWPPPPAAVAAGVVPPPVAVAVAVGVPVAVEVDVGVAVGQIQSALPGQSGLRQKPDAPVMPPLADRQIKSSSQVIWGLTDRLQLLLHPTGVGMTPREKARSVQATHVSRVSWPYPTWALTVKLVTFLGRI